MYKVMLIDDEKLITQGLMHLIEWEKFNLEVAEVAENGEEALEKFKMNQVDIVITDINMPKMTGLEFIKEVKSINENVQFIILSGYDEFSYAKKAMEYGVKNYILKPINEDELEEALKNLVEIINVEKKKRYKDLDKNRKLIDFINGKIEKSDIYKMKHLMNLKFDEECYTVSNIAISKKQYEDGHYNIDDIIEKNTKGSFEILYKFDGQVTLINSWKETDSNEDIYNYYNCIKDVLISELEADVFIAIGDKVNCIDNLKDSYAVANSLKKYILTEGTNKCISKNNIEDKKEYKINFTEKIDKLNKIIIEKDSEKSKKYLESLFNDEELTPKNIYDLSIKIILLIDKLLEEFNLEQKYGRDSLSNTIVELCNKSTRETVKEYIIKDIEELINIMSNTSVKYSPVVQQIVNNVNDKYYEELSLKTLAQQYNINSSYLGQIFTKEVGVSFSEYLNKTKNMKAKDLILETNMKINDIAKEVGYTDTSYFYRKFKKYYGVCPSTLRELKNY
ncbi:MAG: response regulator transcription factor [Clostridium sp.]|uniref:response regulator transcription factor n=1 Tax=Clostridium sp. TaxID=1506 RepID=UPI003F3E071C